MRPLIWLTTAGLCLALGGVGAAREPLPAKAATTCSGDFGTNVLFEDSPKEAAKKALKEEKLVLVFHISGHFEDPGLT
jgi:hypothetical protein